MLRVQQRGDPACASWAEGRPEKQGYSPDMSQRQGGGNVQPTPPNGKESEKRSQRQGRPHLSKRWPPVTEARRSYLPAPEIQV